MEVVANKSRKDMRAVVSLLARYRSPTTFEYVQEACTDVSVGGMFIRSGNPEAAGTLLKLECETQAEGGKVRGVARVVWLRREANEHGPSGMGVKFVKLEPGSKDLINQLVETLAAAGVQARSISLAPETQDASASKRQAASLPPTPHVPVQITGTATPSQPSSPLPAAAVSGRPQSDAKGVSGGPPVQTETQAKQAAGPEAASATAAGQGESDARAAKSSADDGVAVAAAVAVETEHATDAAASSESSAAAGTRDGGQAQQAPAPQSETKATANGTSAVARVGATEPQVAAATTVVENERGHSRSSAVRVWVSVLIVVVALLAIILADEKPRHSNSSPHDTPQTTNNTAQPAAPANPTGDNAPQAHAAQDAPQENPPTAAAEPAPSVPGSEADSPSAKPPAEATTGPTTAGPDDYVLDVVSRPNGATVTVGDTTITAPGELNLGAMPTRVKITAKKNGYQASAAWVERTGFTRVEGIQRRRVVMTLPDLPPGARKP